MRKCAILCVVFFVSGLSVSAYAETVLTPISLVPNSASMDVIGINDNGIITGGYFDKNGIEHGYFGTPDGNYTYFDDGSLGTEGRAINNAGEITGFFLSDSLTSCAAGTCEFDRSADGNLLTVTISGTPLEGIAEEIDSSGLFVGNYSNSGSRKGFYGRNGAYLSDLTLPIPATKTRPRGINDSGEIVGSFVPSNGSPFEGFVLQGDMVTVVTYPNSKAAETLLLGINNKGWIVGHWDTASGKEHGFLLSPDLSKIIPLKVPHAKSYVLPFGLNNADRVVVNSDAGLFVYCNSKMKPHPKCSGPGFATSDEEVIPVTLGFFRRYDCRHVCRSVNLPNN